jgi:hypothetical protein
MDAPPCANFLSGSCERSDTIVEAERGNCFVILCRTCSGRNIWPVDNEEKKGKYESELKRQLIEREKEEAFRRKRAYSGAGR